jgi:hypothetical protein
MMSRNLKWFDSLTKRDFDNGAVIDEIRDVFKERDEFRFELQRIRRSFAAGTHWQNRIPDIAEKLCESIDRLGLEELT